LSHRSFSLRPGASNARKPSLANDKNGTICIRLTILALSRERRESRFQQAAIEAHRSSVCSAVLASPATDDCPDDRQQNARVEHGLIQAESHA
jgi:hypothetical protein